MKKLFLYIIGLFLVFIITYSISYDFFYTHPKIYSKYHTKDINAEFDDFVTDEKLNTSNAVYEEVGNYNKNDKYSDIYENEIMNNNKNNENNEHDYEYSLVISNDSIIIIYNNEFYEKTDITISDIEYETKIEIENGIYFEDIDMLYHYLESISS